MRGIAVTPRTRNSARLVDLPRPDLDEVPDGRGVEVKVLRVGIDGTDREINAGEYGAAPPGSDFLVLGHESFGVVEAVGEAVTEVAPGDYVVAIVRRAGSSLYDRIGMPDLTTDETYHEHGISLVHGFLTEYYVEDADQLVLVPAGLAQPGVLLEPTSVVEKGIAQAYEIQRRLRVWRPRRAVVLGAGTIGLLATLALRLRGLEVTTFGLEEPPHLNSELVEALGARYLSTRQTTLVRESGASGAPDIVFEATGYSPLVFEAMEALGRNGVLMLSSVTGGDRSVEVPADRLNLGFVLGNKVMAGTVNANRDHFERGVIDLAAAEARWPGWAARLLTHRIDGLTECGRAFELLTHAEGAIKIYVEVASG
jgi:glucose 1-dehydrogenase